MLDKGNITAYGSFSQIPACLPSRKSNGTGCLSCCAWITSRRSPTSHEDAEYHVVCDLPNPILVMCVFHLFVWADCPSIGITGFMIARSRLCRKAAARYQQLIKNAVNPRVFFLNFCQHNGHQQLRSCAVCQFACATQFCQTAICKIFLA